MKKILVFAALLGLFGASEALAGKRDNSYLRDSVGTVKYRFDGVTTDTTTIVVDLSDTTNFPHRNTGYVIVQSVRCVVDKIAASSGTVKVGVLTELDASNGSVEWFYTLDFERDTVGTLLESSVNYNASPVRARVNSSGGTPYLLSNDTTSGSTVFQTDVGLPTTNGTAGVFPAAGDIILQFDAVGVVTATDIVCELQYDSER